MNWKLIFMLSLFGLAMSFSTVFWISFPVELVLWFIIFVFCAYAIVTECPDRYFLHGFLVNMVNAIWMTTVRVVLYQSYLANHPQEAMLIRRLYTPDSPRLVMLVLGLPVGAMFGVVLGVFAIIASRTMKKKEIA